MALPWRVRAMLALCEQQARRTAEAVETALAEEHRRQRVTLEGWLASLDDDGSEPEEGETDIAPRARLCAVRRSPEDGVVVSETHFFGATTVSGATV